MAKNGEDTAVEEALRPFVRGGIGRLGALRLATYLKSWREASQAAAWMDIDDVRARSILDAASKAGVVEKRSQAGRDQYRAVAGDGKRLGNNPKKGMIRKVPLTIPFNLRDWRWLRQQLGTWASAESIAPTARVDVDIVHLQIAQGLANGWLTRSQVDIRKVSLAKRPDISGRPRSASNDRVWDLLSDWQTHKSLAKTMGLTETRMQQLVKPLVEKGYVNVSEASRWWFIRADRLPPPYEHRVLGAPIAALGLPLQVEWALRQEGVDRVGDLCSRDELDILCIPEFDRGYLDTVTEALEKAGLFLGMVLPDWPLPPLPDHPFADEVSPNIRLERDILDTHLVSWKSQSELAEASGKSEQVVGQMLVNAVNQGYVRKIGTTQFRYGLASMEGVALPSPDELALAAATLSDIPLATYLETRRETKLRLVYRAVAENPGITAMGIGRILPCEPVRVVGHEAIIRTLLQDLVAGGYLLSRTAVTGKRGRSLAFSVSGKPLPETDHVRDSNPSADAIENIAEFRPAMAPERKPERAKDDAVKEFPYKRKIPKNRLRKSNLAPVEWRRLSLRLGRDIDLDALVADTGMVPEIAGRALAHAVAAGHLVPSGAGFAPVARPQIQPGVDSMTGLLGADKGAAFASWCTAKSTAARLGVTYATASNYIRTGRVTGALVESDVTPRWFIDVSCLDPKGHRLLGSALEVLGLPAWDISVFRDAGVMTVADLLRLDRDGIAAVTGTGEPVERVVRAMAFRWLEPGKGVSQVPASSFSRTPSFDPLPPPDRRLVDTCLAEGNGLTAARYADLSGLPEDKARAVLAEASAKGLLIDRGSDRLRVYAADPRWR